jgi:hypothetical protein
MKRLRILSPLLLAILLASAAEFPARADEAKKQPKTPALQNPLTIRESEILGTLEKPQFSTDLPWKSPLIDRFNGYLPGTYDNTREIYRSIRPVPEIRK